VCLEKHILVKVWCKIFSHIILLNNREHIVKKIIFFFYQVLGNAQLFFIYLHNYILPNTNLLLSFYFWWEFTCVIMKLQMTIIIDLIRMKFIHSQDHRINSWFKYDNCFSDWYWFITTYDQFVFLFLKSY